MNLWSYKLTLSRLVSWLAPKVHSVGAVQCALIQMAGHAGSGKSTLARLLATRIGGVVLDLDTIKSALLDSGIGWAEASSGSYEIIYGLVRDMLATSGPAVIVDTPSYWPDIHQQLTAAADAHGVAYRFIECVADESVRADRLAKRPTRRSQIRELGMNAVDAPADADAMHLRPVERPTDRTCMRVECSTEVDVGDVIARLALST